MLKCKSFQLVISAVIAFSVLVPFVSYAVITTDKGGQPDVIIIGLGPELSKDEMADVAFRHDLHTRVLDNNCTACHYEKKGRLDFSFGHADTPASMDLYHGECISCHEQKKGENKATGPVTDQCGACHVRKPVLAPKQKKIPFDRSLHYTHVSSGKIKAMDAGDEQNCSACHHGFDEQKQTLVFKKGQEGACVYCHRETPSQLASGKQVKDIRQASHQSCVACHQKVMSQKQSAGPVTCAGCHDEKEQAKLDKRETVPRLKRGQPDAVVLTPWQPGTDEKTTFMPAVAFDHKAHEAMELSCKSCHHDTLKKCRDCHTPDGGQEKGGFVSLADAMHTPFSNRSCMGCHQELTTTSAECAGCHAQMPATVKKDPESCKTCHGVASGKRLAGSDLEGLAKDEIAGRKHRYTPVPADQIPETVVIDDLVDEYKASQFPHGKVVRAIMKKADKSALARTFHQDQAGLCMGCHHNSPRSLEPPKCAACHSKSGPGADGRPGLKGAFHGQCISCHQKMKVASVQATDCIKCHELKN
jgi:cytochrome c553